MGTDGIAGVHSPTYDSIYTAALDIDYVKLDVTQSRAVDVLRSGEVHVTTPAGTDISRGRHLSLCPYDICLTRHATHHRCGSGPVRFPDWI